MGMIDKIRYLNECLQNGKALMRPEIWSDRASRIGTIQHLLTAALALAAAFGYQLNVPSTDIAALAVAISVVVGILGQISSLIHTAANKSAGRTVSRDTIFSEELHMWKRIVGWFSVYASGIGGAIYYIVSLLAHGGV